MGEIGPFILDRYDGREEKRHPIMPHIFGGTWPSDTLIMILMPARICCEDVNFVINIGLFKLGESNSTQ